MYLNAGGTLFAVNAATGESIWTMAMEDTLEARGRGPSYGDGKLYAFGGATMLYHLAALWAAFVLFTVLFARDDPAHRAYAPPALVRS